MKERRPKYRHIIWDWNGTLYDDVWLCIDVIGDLLQRRGMAPITREQYEEMFSIPVREYYRKLGFDLDAEPFEALANEFMADYERRRHECRLRDGAVEVLRFCADRGISQSVLSAYEQKALEGLLDAYEISHFFERVVGLDDHYAGGKIENGKRLVEGLGCEAGDVLMIGDMVHDFEAARAMGADCALVHGGHHPRAALKACDAPLLDSLTDVLELLG